MDFILKWLSDKIFKVKDFERQYLAAHPDQEVLISESVNGIINKGNSKRGVLLLTKDRLVYDNTEIKFSDIDKSKLVTVKSNMSKGLVLVALLKNGTEYQWGMPYNTQWLNQTALSIPKEDHVMGMPMLGNIVKLLLIGYLVYIVYRLVTN